MPPRATQNRRALVVFESMFGNTEQVARTVAETLEQQGWTVETRAVTDPDVPRGSLDVDLVVVGAPTHAFSLSRASTRADAVRQGADPARAPVGVREWLGDAAPPTGRHVPLVALDTRVAKVRHLPMAAGPRALELARRRGFDTPVAAGAFLVTDTPGPLLEEELARARTWAVEVLDRVGPAVGSAVEGEHRS